MSAPETVTLRVNGESRQLDIDPETPLLYALRDDLGLEEPEVRLRYRALRRLQSAH